ncbi:MAG: Ycf51 family protein [Geitlerinemataceae cyanobacterium]
MPTMPTTADFLQATQWMGIITLVCAALAVLGFVLQWGIRFRLVGIASFLAVLTVGSFSLSLVPFAPTVIPGSIRYTVVYDNGAAQVVIKVPSDITETQLEATLRQAATNQFSSGRLAQGQNLLVLRARTIIHPEPGISKPLVLGQVMRSFSSEGEDPWEFEVYHDRFAELPEVASS